MKHTLCLLTALILSLAANAQPWMKDRKDGPVKFADAVAAYEREEKDKEEEKKNFTEYGEAVREDENYHFDRWYWYWKQHLDTNGYIVSKGRSLKEWNSFISMQGKAAKSTAASNWIFQGPDHSDGGYSGIGRVNVVGFDPVDANTLYVGAAAGSAWKSTDGGNTWACLYDVMGTLSVSDIKVNPLNRNTVYVATGDVNGNDDYSIGIIKSYDGGAHWVTMGPPWTVDSFKIVSTVLVNPRDTNKLVIGSSSGIYKSADGGASWQRTYNSNIRQVLFCPNDTNILYATTQGSGSAQIIKSGDGGYTWHTATAFVAVSRINIAVCPASPGIVKAIAASSSNGLEGIYHSPDHGDTYVQVYTDDAACAKNLLSWDIGFPTTTCGGQGWYDLCIAIDPINENKVIIGGVNNYYSTDGGSSWTIANQWYNAGPDLQTVHADKHYLGYSPLNGAIYLGCDGGIYKTTAPVTGLWKDLSNGLGITQFYRNAVDNGATFCLGGAQDNGSKKLDGGVSDDMTGGDGMQPLINYGNPNDVFYCAYQNGHVDITTNGGISFSSITEELPTPGAWITPYTIHPSDPSILYIGYKQVFQSLDLGGSWAPISPVFNSTANIEILKVSVADPNYIYVVRENGALSRIHYTTNGGVSWNILSSTFPTSISDLEIDPENAGHIWVTLSGYGTQKVKSYDMATSLWTDESAGLPNLPVNCIVVDTYSHARYVGTDAAVFYKSDAMTSWALYNTHLPSVQVYDLNINYTTNEIWAATYGRGMWKSLKSDIPVGVVMHQSLADVVSISPNPAHNSFTIATTGLSFRNAAVRLRILSAAGTTVYSTSGVFDNTGRLKVQVEGLPPGFYICEVDNKNAATKAKLVIY